MGRRTPQDVVVKIREAAAGLADLGVTPDELARFGKVSKATVYRVLRKPPPPQALTIRQVAAELGVSDSTVRALCDRGLLESFRVGRARRVTVEALERYRASLTPPRSPTKYRHL